MDIQSSVLNQLFVLYSVIIQGWVSPLKPADLAHGGIPKSLYDGEPQGLECLVDPWGELQLRSWTMAAYDRVDLYLNNDPTAVTGKTVAPGEEQLRIRLYVPHGRLRNGVNRIYYRVKRASGNDSEVSRDLNVLYYLRSPGEPAPQGLDLEIPPDVIKDGVDAARAARGVEFGFTYSNQRAYDRIRFQLGDESVEWEIPDASAPATKTLFTDTFQQVGDNPNLLLDFVVFDQLGNFSRSSTKQIDVHLGRSNLLPPILREIPTENDDDPDTVDLAKLNGNPLSALVHLVDTIWKTGDSIKLVFTAELNGDVVATHEETHPITQVPSQFLWTIPNNKIIPNSTVKVVYQQIRGTPIATSAPAIAQVFGEGAIKLNPPTLVAPAISPIDLWLYLTGVILRIEFLAAAAGDKARLIEINPPAGATPFPDVAFNANKRTNTVLSPAFLAARHGKELTFRWALIRGNEEIARSGSLMLTVNQIVDADPRLPTPAIKDLTVTELDVNNLVAGDTLSIAKWLLQEAGQYVWLQLSGFNNSGAPIFFDVLGGVLHNETQGLTQSLGQALVDWFKTLKHGTAVAITFRVNFGKVADLNAAVMFPVREYMVKSVVDEKPVITEAVGSDGIVIPHGGTTFYKTVTLKGTASKGQTVAIFDGLTNMGDARADLTTGIWTKSVSGLSEAEHHFTAKALYGSGQVSEPRTLTVAAGLDVDTSRIYLSGAHLSLNDTGLNWTLSSDPPGTSIIRSVTGGVPPYSYSTSDDQTASVDSRTGTIRSVWNGTATITITDDIGQKKTIEVTVSNVARLFYNPTPMTVQQAAAWITSIGGRPFDHSAIGWQYGRPLVCYHTNNNPPPNTSPAFNGGWKLDNNWAGGYFTTPTGTINGPGSYAFETRAPGICFRQT